MKIVVMVNNYNPLMDSGNSGWYLLADSAVTNTGKPFYLPEEMGKTQVSVCGAIKISRLGKSISPQFAARYYSEYAPSLHFTLPEYGEKLKKAGLPEDASRSFDRSLFLGDFIPIKDKEPLKLKINGEIKIEFDFKQLNLKIDEIISSVSKMNTMKIGDIIVPGLSRFIEIKEGDFMEVVKGEERLFHVKVK